jgi:hypothetical protein
VQTLVAVRSLREELELAPTSLATAAAQGDTPAEQNLAVMDCKGQGLPQDYKRVYMDLAMNAASITYLGPAQHRRNMH